MHTTKQANAVVISLDAYRERRRLSSAITRNENWREVKPSFEMNDGGHDEDRAEDAHRLLLMPGLRRPDERELL